MKSIFVAAAVFAMTTGGAFAQSVSTETTTRTVSPTGQEQIDITKQQKGLDGSTVTKNYTRTEGDASVKVDRSEVTTDSDGNQSERSRSVTRDANGTNVKSKTKTTTATGTEETVRIERRDQ